MGGEEVHRADHGAVDDHRQLQRVRIPDLMRAFHPIYAEASDELLWQIDDGYAHGTLRDWAAFTHTAQGCAATPALTGWTSRSWPTPTPCSAQVSMPEAAWLPQGSARDFLWAGRPLRRRFGPPPHPALVLDPGEFRVTIAYLSGVDHRRTDPGWRWLVMRLPPGATDRNSLALDVLAALGKNHEFLRQERLGPAGGTWPAA